MGTKIKTSILLLLSILSLFAPTTKVFAGNVTITATCNVQVTIKATVPDSVEQGNSFTVSDITVQPANTYGLNVTSSFYYMTANNTSSTTYVQNFTATNPSPTKGHTTYIGYYPNWKLDASGPVGSAVTITLVKSVTVIQGYGGSPVTCTFSKILASVPIIAAAGTPPPPSQSSQPSTQPSSSSQPPAGSTNTTPVSATVTDTPTPSPSTASSAAVQPGDVSQTSSSSSAEPGQQSVSVVPLNLVVNDNKGKHIVGAEVTLDQSKKLITDNNGKVTFSNVLTGAHAILVSYNGQKFNSTITLGAADVGKVKAVNLPAPPQTLNPYVIGGAATAVALCGAGAFLLLRRRKAGETVANDQQDMSIHGIIDGSAVPVAAESPIEHIPAIPAFAPQPAAAPTPAPWDPASVAVLPGAAQPATSATPAQPNVAFLQYAAPTSAPLATPPAVESPVATLTPALAVTMPQPTHQTVALSIPPSPDPQITPSPMSTPDVSPDPTGTVIAKSP